MRVTSDCDRNVVPNNSYVYLGSSGRQVCAEGSIETADQPGKS